MKPTIAVNSALCLLVLGWPCLIYGALSQLGDPAPWVTAAEIRSRVQLSVSVMAIGVLALLGSATLAGYGFRAARKRSALAVLGILIPVVVMFVFAVRG